MLDRRRNTAIIYGSMMQQARLILYHKQATSARILFLRWHGTVCHGNGLPPASQVIASTLELEEEQRQVKLPPATFIPEVEQQLGLTDIPLEIDGEFQATVEGGGESIEIYLAHFTTTDPPYEQIAAIEGKFIAITEARSLAPAELELLRLVYSFLMDG
jgi:hypothetical protein